MRVLLGFTASALTLAASVQAPVVLDVTQTQSRRQDLRPQIASRATLGDMARLGARRASALVAVRLAGLQIHSHWQDRRQMTALRVLLGGTVARAAQALSAQATVPQGDSQTWTQRQAPQRPTASHVR